jgi:hypothetical protein
MKLKYFGIPTVILGALLALWLYMRKGVSSRPAQFQPSPASSGVPAWSEQAQDYNTAPKQVSPAQAVATQLANTLNPTPSIDSVRAAQPTVFGNDNENRLTYNVPPSGNLSSNGRQGLSTSQAGSVLTGAKEASCGCGGKESCKSYCADNNGQFTDGQGRGCMAVSRKKQIDHLEQRYPGVWDKFNDQVIMSGFTGADIARISYVGMQGNQNSGMPEIQSDKTLPAAPGEWIHPMIYRARA